MQYSQVLLLLLLLALNGGSADPHFVLSFDADPIMVDPSTPSCEPFQSRGWAAERLMRGRKGGRREHTRVRACIGDAPFPEYQTFALLNS